jgi:hypothetical protein
VDQEFILLGRARKDLERAEAAKAKTELALQGLEIEVTRLRNFIEQFEIYNQKAAKQTVQTGGRQKGAVLMDNVVSILEKSLKPMSIHELLGALARASIEVGGENAATNLAAYMSKDYRVTFSKGIGWTLSSELAGGFAKSEPVNVVKVTDRKDTGGFIAKNPPPDLDDDIPF